MPQYYYTPPNSSYPPVTNYNQAPQGKGSNDFFELKAKQKKEQKELRRFGCYLGTAIVAYLIIQVLSSLALQKLGWTELYSSSPIFQYAFTILFVSVLSVAAPFAVVALINRKKYTYPIIPNKKIEFSRILQWSFLGLGCCVCSNIIVGFVINFVKAVFHRQLTQGETATPTNIAECLFELIGIAVIPAICEELSMRCFSLQLLRKYGTGFAVYTVSIVFGLLHGNVIQFLFAFLVGLILAAVTVKTESIVPAIVIHMCNNAMSVINDTANLFLKNENVSEYITAGLFIAFGVAGIISAICLFFKKEFSGSFSKGDTVLSLSQKIKSFYFPGMIVPFVMLIALTLTTIKKI